MAKGPRLAPVVASLSVVVDPRVGWVAVRVCGSQELSGGGGRLLAYSLHAEEGLLGDVQGLARVTEIPSLGPLVEDGFADRQSRHGRGRVRQAWLNACWPL